MKFLQHVEITTARFAALTAAMVFYALAGSPSPDAPGIVEIVVGVLLIVAVGFPALWRTIVFDPKRPLWQTAGWLLLVGGLTVSVVAAMIHGNDVRLVIRDLPPFFFLFLPLLAADIFEKRPDYFRLFLFAFIFMGLAFALRGLNETGFFNPQLEADTKELYYFANAPSVLFAAVFLPGFALEKYLRTLSMRSAGFLIVAAGLTMLPLLAMAFTLQRASLGWAGLSVFLFAAWGFWRFPRRMIILLPLAAVVFFVLREPFFTVLESLTHKTEIYGINKRGMELAAVWDELSISPLSVLLGLGWGGTFESPAVAGARINFTHSFITGMLLKTGVMGLLVAAVYISGFFTALPGLWRRDFILAMAAAGPLVIDVFLYASYKWLDFGLLLLLLAVAARLHRSAAYCIHKG